MYIFEPELTNAEWSIIIIIAIVALDHILYKFDKTYG